MRLSSMGLAVASCLAALVFAGPASASPAPFTEAQAKKQLREVERAGSAPIRADLTLALRDLALALPKLDGAAERRARSILSRPPNDNSPSDEGGWPANANEQIVETPDFIVHYALVPGCDVAQPNPDVNCDEPNLTDADENDIPDYVDAAVEAINESIAVENGELGWPLSKGDGDKGEPNGSSEEDRFDVYLSDLCDENDGNPCFFGYAAPDDASSECTGAPFKCSSHLVVDNDYDEFGASGGELGLRVTTAHEYNHAIQFNIDSNQDSWMFESTATWSEEQVFPADDDWVRSYMPSWTKESLIPVTKKNFHYYGSAVWNHWLENGDGSYGPDVVLNAWQSSRDVTPKDYAVGAYDNAIKDEGGTGFPQEFAAFTAATAEWKTGDGGFPDASELPSVERLGKLKFDGDPLNRKLDNTSYALFEVNPKDANQIKLKGTSDGGVQWSVALVGRDGSSTDGTVERLVNYSEGGEKSSVILKGAQSFERITAVVTNADGHVSGSKPTFGEFSYTRNGEHFKLKIR